MELKVNLLALLGTLFGILFTIFSLSVQDKEWIWIQTRIFGLVAYIFLFLTITIGELRVLSKNKAEFSFFRYHVPAALFTMYLLLLHFISGVADNYKWGKQLSFVQYLGFSFSDKWLVLLSLGTLAFYLILLVGATSYKKNIQLLGYKTWKAIHYLSYISFVLAFIHSINLGTDLKQGPLASYLNPIFVVMFLCVLALFLTRIFHAFGAFSDQMEINIAAAFFIVLLISSVFLVSHTLNKEAEMKELQVQLKDSQSALVSYQQAIETLKAENAKTVSDRTALQKQIDEIDKKMAGVNNE